MAFLPAHWLIAALMMVTSPQAEAKQPRLQFVLETPGNVRTQKVADSGIRLREGRGWLRTRAIYQDFELALEFRLASDASDAGLSFRALTAEGEWPRRGYRIRLSPADAGAIDSRHYQLKAVERGGPVGVATGQWHRLMLRGEGRTVALSIDGISVGTFDVDVLEGSFVFDANKGEAEFRNITIVARPWDSLTDVSEAKRLKTLSKAPRLSKDVPPRYPRSAMEHNVNGLVGLEALVQEDGTVGPVHVTRPLDPELDQAAVVALRQWRFIPATIGDRAVKYVVEIEMTFTVK